MRKSFLGNRVKIIVNCKGRETHDKLRNCAANLGQCVVCGARCDLSLSSDHFRVLQLDDSTRLVLVLRKCREEILPPVKFIAVYYDLPQRVRPRDLKKKSNFVKS